ncbi:glucose-6-phosphate isomerase [Woeseia oceani]|uniref:glucose-6-phosphate isomerase n=1 Tax=Woeseia oceani TaxID=1548547 RepID=UPI000B261BC7|nr:glucose-6-phosphate isomerase [Woeseia oceani]
MPQTKLSARYPLDLPVWQELKDHYRTKMKRADMRDMFKCDKRRVERFTLDAGDLHLDYSKNLINAETQKLLARLTCEAGVPAAIESMFTGKELNITEERSVLHVALRSKMSDQIALEVDGVREIWGVLTKIESFVEAVHAGKIAGEGGKRFTDIVNIGIGGSDLGLVMATNALRPYWRKGLRFHAVSNIDGTQLADLHSELDPATTLFIVCSKTFTTLETITNAQAARAWVKDVLGEEAVVRHFAAASTNHAAMDAFGISPEFRFGFWDWVGGRYSLWSAVGLSLALMVGIDHFKSVLAGARRMDMHFRTAPATENMPVVMALLAVWYSNFFGAESQAILPYTNRLDRLPAYLQQLQMESNGKSVRRDGRPVKVKTGQIIWGEPGSNAQHSFYQLLHQGTRFVPIDFILPVETVGEGNGLQQKLAIANCLAQSEALMEGYSADDARVEMRAAGVAAGRANSLARHKEHAGNRPSSTILFRALTPAVLGQLIALYEHKVFVEGTLYGINSFDQFGVELGKHLANQLTAVVQQDEAYNGRNISTTALLKRSR